LKIVKWIAVSWNGIWLACAGLQVPRAAAARTKRRIFRSTIASCGWIDGPVVLLQHARADRQSPRRIAEGRGGAHRLGAVHLQRANDYGRWFKQDTATLCRLSPHPRDHKVETRALAKAADLDPNLVETLNVFQLFPALASLCLDDRR
jgi:hypothetical protein